jgi:Putative MetA-pathway of phenol degradation
VKNCLLVALIAVISLGSSAIAQTSEIPCPAGFRSDKLVCLIPQVYGPNGLVVENTSFNALGVAQFQNSLPQALNPLNSSIARQTALLPLASPYSGIRFSWDPGSRVYIASTGSLGPVLGDRAETIGRYRISLGFAYQHFEFESHDGINLDSLPAVFTQPDTLATSFGTVCSLPPPDSTANMGDACAFIRDIVTSDNKIDLKLHQFTTFITFGITNRIDVSMAIPIENVRMGIQSLATIKDISQNALHRFPVASSPLCSPSDQLCLQTSTSQFRTASGIGDITFRVKGVAAKGERSAFAIGVDIRTPTGDALNFLGAGAPGLKPFVAWSYTSRISPYVNVGYEVNGSSVTAGDVTTGREDKLPSQLTYSAGADIGVTRWLTAALGIVGQEVLQAPRLASSTFEEPLKCIPDVNSACPALAAPPAPTDPNVVATTGSYNISNISVGAKLKPFARLVITGNVLIRVNDGGLRAKPVPLIGVSYTF